MMNARYAAEKSAAVAQLRTIHTNQMVYMSQRGRYARLNELNAYFRNSLGRTSGTQINKQNFIYIMSPTPTDASLRTGYRILALNLKNGRVQSMFSIAEDGRINTIIP
jgi:hypothetical protein